MGIQSSGTLTEAQIRNEFGGPATNISLNAYHKGLSNGYVPVTTTNINIPSGNNTPIKISDFYGSSHYAVTVIVTVNPESATQYSNANDGNVSVYCNGTSPSYIVTIGSSQAVIGNGGTHSVTMLDSDVTVAISMEDVKGSHSLGSYAIGLAPGNGQQTRTFNLT